MSSRGENFTNCEPMCIAMPTTSIDGRLGARQEEGFGLLPGNPEFVVCRASGDFLVGLRIDIRIDADGHACGCVLRCGKLRELLKFLV